MFHKLYIKEKTFDSCHYLHEDFGKCHCMHGHTYTLKDLYILTDGIVDFGLIKKVIDSFDHLIMAPEKDRSFWEQVSKIPNSPVVFKIMYIPYELTTCEYISRFFAEKLLCLPGVISTKFKLFETPTQGVEVDSNNLILKGDSK